MKKFRKPTRRVFWPLLALAVCAVGWRSNAVPSLTCIQAYQYYLEAQTEYEECAEAGLGTACDPIYEEAMWRWAWVELYCNFSE